MTTPIASPTRLIIHGAAGRMGSRLCALALESPDFNLVAAVEHDASPHLGRPASPASSQSPAIQNAHAVRNSADVVIDFTADHAVPAAVELAAQAHAALLVGTTGLTDQSRSLLTRHAASSAVLIAPNTSLGITILASLTKLAASLLAKDFDLSIVEAHHNAKKDAPSGTALRLAAALRDGGADIPDDQVLAIRGGDVIGEHTVRYAGQGEYIELTHRATSRDLFVRGALKAARWLHTQRPGLYSMEDVLKISAEPGKNAT